MPLILPGESAEVAAHKAEQGRQIRAAEKRLFGLEKELKAIDPSLSLIFAPPGARDVGLLPGRWHIRKDIPNAPDEFWPLVGPNDSYREPGAWVLDEFNANDLWDRRVHRDKKEARRKLREARLRAQKNEAEARAEEIDFQARAARRVRGLSGLSKRTDLKASKATLEARRAATKKP